MRTLSLLAAAAMLVFSLGCKSPSVKDDTKAIATTGVSINDCKATPDPVVVKDLGKVDWQPVDHDYTISFKHPAEPTANPFKAVHGSHNAHTMHGHSGCDPLGHGEFYCKYSLTKDTQPSPCADPGVHIVP